MIRVTNICYRVGKKKILNNLSFEASQGQVFAIIGANGAGKSTLLKLLCRDLTPSAGYILFNDKNLTTYPQKQLALMRSVLTQRHTISLSFTVTELVLMGRYPHFDHQPSNHDLDMVTKAMQGTGISHLAERTYDTLSGGEQQRVQLARVIAQIQDVPGGWLFLDEPTNGLDLLHQQQLLKQARQMADNGYGVICILHDINLASMYADKILMLKDGEQLSFGAPDKVINYENIHQAFGIRVKLINNENFKNPLVVSGGRIDYN